MAKRVSKQSRLEAEYKRELTRAHRSWGQRRRQFGENDPLRKASFEEATGYIAPQKITAGSIARLKQFEATATILGEQQQIRNVEYRTLLEKARAQWRPYTFLSTGEVFDSITDYEVVTAPTEEDIEELRNLYEDSLALNNLIDMLDAGFDMVSSSNRLAKAGARQLNDTLHWIIVEAIRKNGFSDIIDGIKSFVSSQGRMVERFAMSVIDTGNGGFNTNSRWFRKDKYGNAGRQRFLQFAEELCNALGVPELVNDIYQVMI